MKSCYIHRKYRYYYFWKNYYNPDSVIFSFFIVLVNMKLIGCCSMLQIWGSFDWLLLYATDLRSLWLVVSRWRTRWPIAYSRWWPAPGTVCGGWRSSPSPPPLTPSPKTPSLTPRSSPRSCQVPSDQQRPASVCVCL